MKKTSTDLGLLIMRLGFSAGMLTHGYGKLLRVIEGNFQFKNPIGIGSELSLILVTFSEFIAPIFIILGLKTRLFTLFPTITMLVAFTIAHDGDPFSTKEKSFV